MLAGSLDQFIDYVFLFDNDVGGLHPGAAVQYRGIRVGTVISAPLSHRRQGRPAVQKPADPGAGAHRGAASLPPLCQCGERAVAGLFNKSSSKEGLRPASRPPAC